MVRALRAAAARARGSFRLDDGSDNEEDGHDTDVYLDVNESLDSESVYSDEDWGDDQDEGQYYDQDEGQDYNHDYDQKTSKTIENKTTSTMNKTRAERSSRGKRRMPTQTVEYDNSPPQWKKPKASNTTTPTSLLSGSSSSSATTTEPITPTNMMQLTESDMKLEGSSFISLDAISDQNLSDQGDNASPIHESENDNDDIPHRQPQTSRYRNLYEKTMASLESYHPQIKSLWHSIDEQAPPDPRSCVTYTQPPELITKLLPFQREGIQWLLERETSHYKGSILADEMGMGKTLQTIALILATKPKGKPAKNLVIVPTVALIQWKNEIEQHTGQALKTLLYYGKDRNVKAEVLEEYDVVITTYAVLEYNYRRQTKGLRRKNGIFKEASELHLVSWHRIILDEAHNIKARQCQTSKAAFSLEGERKLCLSGTPLQNRIGELYSLLKFLELDPFHIYFCRKCDCASDTWKFPDYRSCSICGHPPMSHSCFFNLEILKPIQKFGNTGFGVQAFSKLGKLLRNVMLRRTKVERADDIGLPPRVVHVRSYLFNEEEEDLYESLYNDSQRRFDTYLENGVVLNNYANIFQLITRMRQMADHPDLVLRKHKTNAIESKLVCRICDDEAEDAIRSNCHHTFCRLCITEYINGTDIENPLCPACNVALSIDLTSPALEVGDETAFKYSSIVNRIDMTKWRSSTKIEALVEELYKLQRKDSSIKSLVFSQFKNFLDLIEWRLRRAGFKCVKLDGSMGPQARNSTIKQFMENPSITVFLISLKAGGVGLNLTEASHCFIMDPWWNPAVSSQAADRIHRIGQKRPVQIIHLVIENSIESRILELQAKKSSMMNAVVDYDEASLDRLSPADIQFLFNQ